MNKSCTGFIVLVCAALFGMQLSSSALASDLPKLVETCNACHGKDGNSTESDVPSIAGNSESYIASTINKYQKKERYCVETEFRTGSKKGTKTDMCKIANDLSASDIEQIGQYFAEKTYIRTAQIFDAALAKKGKSIHNNKCATCHNEAGTSPIDNAGILGAQKMAYLKQQIKFFKEGKRPISNKMKPKLESLDDAQIDAVIHYYGSVQ